MNKGERVVKVWYMKCGWLEQMNELWWCLKINWVGLREDMIILVVLSCFHCSQGVLV